MKVLMMASFLLYSSLSMAGYNCQELDSKLLIKQLTQKKVNVVLFIKSGPGMVKKTFKGTEIEQDMATYFKVSNFKLKDSQGVEASLKLSFVPVITRVPQTRVPHESCTHRRICLKSLNAIEISAELDYQGKVAVYDCQEDGL
jgi:hypothetical protein